MSQQVGETPAPEKKPHARLAIFDPKFVPTFLGGVAVVLYVGAKAILVITQHDGAAFVSVDAAMGVVGTLTAIASAYGATSWNFRNMEDGPVNLDD